MKAQTLLTDDLKELFIELSIILLMCGVVGLGFLLRREVRNLRHMQKVLDATVERCGARWLETPPTIEEIRSIQEQINSR